MIGFFDVVNRHKCASHVSFSPHSTCRNSFNWVLYLSGIAISSRQSSSSQVLFSCVSHVGFSICLNL